MKKALIDFAKTHLLIIAGFLALSIVYMYPVLEGKVLSLHDMDQFDGMRQELKAYHEETGEYSQWTNSIFSGMPAFHVGEYGAKTTVFRELSKVTRLGLGYRSPIGILFVYFICFYVLLLVLRVNPWLSAIGAAAFALSSYNLIILAVGHLSKAYAIAYMAPVVGGMLLTYRGKLLRGGILFMLGLGMELYSNHLQITYYLLFIAVAIVLAKWVWAIKEKQVRSFFTASGVLLAGAVLALLPNLSSLWVNYEISKQSMRGEPVLADNSDNQTTGLDKDYALAWSYGKAETFSLMIPYMTGGKTGAIGENEQAMMKVDPQYRESVAGQNQYWGAKASTQGDNYSGAIVVFFFILGLLLIKGPMRWWVVVTTLLSITLAWGNNFRGLSDFFLDHIPLYNKFRTVEMILVIACFNIPLMAFVAVEQIRKEPDFLVKSKKQLLIAFGLTGGLSLLFFLVPGIFSFFSEYEQQVFRQQLAGAQPQYAEQFRTFMGELEKARIAIFRHDAIRSFVLIGLAFLLTWFYAGKKLRASWFLGGLGILIIADLWLVDLRYLNKDNFISQREKREAIAATPADNFILEDPDLHFKVANLTKSVWQDGTTSMYHSSIGGYHGAKLQRYQDLIDHYLSPELQMLVTVLNESPTRADVDSVLVRLNGLNMIDTKYFILNPAGQPLENPYAFGSAWLVKDYRIVADANEEIASLATTNLLETAVVERPFGHVLSDDLKHDSVSGSVELTEYRPNRMTYRANLDQKTLVVFSEIDYENGWHATIDGQPVEHLRADYLLRALPVDAGEHTIVFEFRFRPFDAGEKISLAGSFLVILVLLGGVGFSVYSGDSRKRTITEPAIKEKPLNQG
ncbi:MAG: YfhO family protein [Bacteroidales bacterium]